LGARRDQHGADAGGDPEAARHHMTDDPYSNHSTGTLHNLLGIADAATLRRVEADLSYAAIVER
jgi:hypothetical protein